MSVVLTLSRHSADLDISTRPIQPLLTLFLSSSSQFLIETFILVSRGLKGVQSSQLRLETRSLLKRPSPDQLTR